MKTLTSIILLLGLSAITTPGFAMEKSPEKTSPFPVKSPTQSTGNHFELKKKDYKRTSYPTVRLLGPIDFSIEENYSVKRFQNLTASRAQLVSNPDISRSFETDQYYKSTVAKAGFKFKF